MRYNVSRAFDVLLNPDELLYRRAVTLYELQVAILSCNGLAKSTQRNSSELVINADRRLLRSARALSTLQLLQHAANLHDLEGVRNEMKMLPLLADRDALELISDVVFGKIGLERVRYAQQPKDLSAKIDQLQIESDCVFALADFSLRFPNNHRSRKKGGITTALDTIFEYVKDSTEPVYRLARSEHSARNYARRRQPVIALIWLGHKFPGFFPPPQIHTKSFARKLVSLARRQPRLARIAGAYECVAAKLRQRGYCCPSLKLKRYVEPLTIDFEPLPAELIMLV